MATPQTEDRSRLIARLVRDLLATETFDTLADLTDVLKYRLARLRITWTPDDISNALAAIESNRPLVRDDRRRDDRLGIPCRPGPENETRPYSREEATAFLAQWGIRL